MTGRRECYKLCFILLALLTLILLFYVHRRVFQYNDNLNRLDKNEVYFNSRSILDTFFSKWSSPIGSFNEFTTIDSTNVASHFDRKYILDWTLFFGQPFSTDFQLSSCLWMNCVFTTNRSIIELSSAVVFHRADLKWNDLPNYRRPDQYFAFLSHESPANTKVFDLSLAPKNYFNLSLSTRRDSNVYFPYAMFVKEPSIFDDNEISIAKTVISSKSRLVAWFVSNCKTAGHREDYVKVLSKFIDIDVYGKCGTLKCNDRKSCRRMLNKKYKFYLAFENSFCEDYVTEKFLYLFDRDTFVIPVVIYKKNYEGFAPPGSYIAAEDFPSPKHLANYLRYLDSNLTAYLDYFQYKTSYKASLCHKGKQCGFCRLCQLIQMQTPPYHTVEDINAWWNKPGGCDDNVVRRLLG